MRGQTRHDAEGWPLLISFPPRRLRGDSWARGHTGVLRQSIKIVHVSHAASAPPWEYRAVRQRSILFISCTYTHARYLFSTHCVIRACSLSRTRPSLLSERFYFHRAFIISEPHCLRPCETCVACNFPRGALVTVFCPTANTGPSLKKSASKMILRRGRRWRKKWRFNPRPAPPEAPRVQSFF
jgi:hypothetical protein